APTIVVTARFGPGHDAQINIVRMVPLPVKLEFVGITRAPVRIGRALATRQPRDIEPRMPVSHYQRVLSWSEAFRRLTIDAGEWPSPPFFCHPITNSDLQ